MSKMNKQQERLATTTEGFVVADAGPGTGKTFTVVRRYMNIIDKNVDPSKILMVTFTRNGAREMGERITNALFEKAQSETDPEKKERYRGCVKNVKTSTFDALCLKIVMNSPDIISDFFGIKETLSRNVKLTENETFNIQFFERYYMEFVTDPENIKKYGQGKNNILAAMTKYDKELYKLINKLMSRGVIPLYKGWFDNGGTIINGHPPTIKKELSKDLAAFEKMILEIAKKGNDYFLPEGFTRADEKLIDDAAYEDRQILFDFVHDLYFGYIRKSIAENRLTFSLAAIFAFASLYYDEATRRINKVDYLMVDEFQDTNELQMLISLLILNKHNFCVVGDWKQSIYGFRFANMENIVRFDERVDYFITKLNRDGVKRVPFSAETPEKIDLEINYRSSETVLKTGFDTFSIPKVKPEGEVVFLNADRKQEIGDKSEFELIAADTFENEVKSVVSKIIEYMTDPKYKIVDNGVERRPGFKDIAVLCRAGKLGTKILDECLNRGVPAFYQGELEIMSTREAKLALAWLRYVNNKNDQRGLVTILADYGYSLSEIYSFRNGAKWSPPIEIIKQREYLAKKKRRPNNLLTAIFKMYPDLNLDVVQSIINILSDAYDGTLVTISDLISMIEHDIDSGTKYDIDQTLKFEAVTIQTLHKSKGLEYPIVIIAGVNSKTFPDTKGDRSQVIFNEDFGIRFKKEFVVGDDEQANIYISWRYKLIDNTRKKDELEEIRLFFVGLTRAKQYICLSAYKPSVYYDFYQGCGIVPRSNLDLSAKYDNSQSVKTSAIPDISIEKSAKRNLSVHDIMGTFENYVEGEPYPDNNCKGKGKEYGDSVHKQAYLIGRGYKPTEEYPDLENVRKVLSGLNGSKLSLEEKCAYPIDDEHIIRGVIDVLSVFDDRIEIHDYKTDVNRRFLESYQAQLSIYYHTVKSVFGESKPIKCFIDFISPDYDESLGPRFQETDVLGLDELKKAVASYDNNIKETTYGK